MFNFFKRKQSAEEKSEMLYTMGMTFIENGYWEEAFNSITNAAEMGHRGAIGQLAMMYVFGQGCEKNTQKGIDLLYKSVELGNIYSCFAFSVLFDHGINEITPSTAENMCRKAADAGLPEAIDRLKHGFDKRRT